MTPQERHLIDDLFDRLASLENTPRDPDAERAIIEGLRRAPNAAYALVQTTLLQDEALKRANARIEELQGSAQAAQAAPPSSFLDSMRDAVFGPSSTRGSVPNIRPSDAAPSRPVWNSGAALNQGGGDPRLSGYAPAAPGYGAAAPGYGAPMGGGSSFLGTAAAAAVGAIGGSMLMNGIHGLMGGHQAFASTPAFGDVGGPWSSDASNSTLARDAGLDDIGTSASANDDRSGFGQSQGLLDDTSNVDPDDDGFDGDVDNGGGDSDSDFA